jgi:beta-lactam-binding protein with PASTA domain
MSLKLKMVRYMRYILFGLVLLLVAMASALTAMRFAIHGRDVKVPNLAGLVPTAAEATANENGLILVVDQKYYSDTMPEGRIVNQQPGAGVEVRRGWRVHVAVSLGKRKVDIPNVIGESRRAAEINLRRRGLDVANVAEMEADDLPEGQVIAQDPTAQSTNVTSPHVDLLVAVEAPPPAYVMPSFLGRHYADASQVISEAGFVLGKVTTSALASQTGGMQMAPGIILKQTPVPGAKVAMGASVSFEITR